MSKYQDSAGNVIEVGSPDLNPDLVSGKTKVDEATPLGRQPITSGVLQDTTDVDFNNVESPTPSKIGDLDEPAVKSDTPVRDDFDGMLGRLDEIDDSLLGEVGDRAEAEKEAGVDELQKTIDDLGGQLRFFKGRETTIPMEVADEGGDRTRTNQGIATVSASRLRKNAIEAFTVASRIDGINLQLGSARKKVDAAMEEKYGALKLERDQILGNIDILIKSGILSDEEQRQADARKAALIAEQEADNQAKADETAVLNKTNEFAAQVAELENSEEIFFQMENAANELEVIKIALANGLDIPKEALSLTGTSTDLRTFSMLNPDLEVGTAEFRKAFAAWQASNKSVVGGSGGNTGDPIVDEIIGLTNDGVKERVYDTFADGYARKIISEFSAEELEAFMIAYETLSQQAQQSIEPEQFLVEFRAELEKIKNEGKEVEEEEDPNARDIGGPII